MWVWRTVDGSARTFTKGHNDKRCPICGQYFQKNESAIAIIPPMSARSHKKLRQNFMAHQDEWIEFVGDIRDDEELASKFVRHRVPRVHPFTDEEQRRIDAFNQACIYYGFHAEYAKPYGVKRQKHGSSVAIEYNVFGDSIDISHRGKRGLFDGIYKQQIATNIYNKMHEILADGKHDDFSANKAIAEIANEVKTAMQDMGLA